LEEDGKFCSSKRFERRLGVGLLLSLLNIRPLELYQVM